VAYFTPCIVPSFYYKTDKETKLMLDFNTNIRPLSQELGPSLQQKIDAKTKPVGALGKLEAVARQIGLIQNSLTPQLKQPTIIVFAGDHGVAAAGVSPYPQEVTYQMVFNFLAGGAAINVFCRQNGLALKVVDAGVNFDFEPHPALIRAKIAQGTKNYLEEPAMSTTECLAALVKGGEIVAEIQAGGCNVIGFGEMGIGNSSSASLLSSLLAHIPLEQAVGPGTGLDDAGLHRKKELLAQALRTHTPSEPLSILATFGGFEIAMMCGAMLKGAELGMLLLIDGFIATAALLAAHAFNPHVLAYSIFAHQSGEPGHRLVLAFLGAEPLLHLEMRLGEGTGAAVAYPLVQAAVTFLNEMASFESAQVKRISV
jgi:nicotinate-nucleotide--dimethylbenzimidazole phosphoribosyltransferase